MRSFSGVVLVVLSEALLVGCHGGGATGRGALSESSDASVEDARFNGFWVRAPDLAGSGLNSLNIQTLDAGLLIEAVVWRFSSSEGTLHDRPVVGDTFDVRVGLGSQREPGYVGPVFDPGFLNVEWQDSDRLDFFRSADDVVRSAFYSRIAPGLRGYPGALVRVDDVTGPRLRLPPTLAAELGLEPDETLLQQYPQSANLGWPELLMSSGGAYRTANWPSPLTQLPDGGLPFTEWPASRLEIDSDGNYRFFQLVEGRPFSRRGVVTAAQQGPWEFTVQDVTLPLELDDGSLVPTELAAFAGGEERAYDRLDADAGPGHDELIITGLDSAPFHYEVRDLGTIPDPNAPPVTRP